MIYYVSLLLGKTYFFHPVFPIYHMGLYYQYNIHLSSWQFDKNFFLKDLLPFLMPLSKWAKNRRLVSNHKNISKKLHVIWDTLLTWAIAITWWWNHLWNHWANFNQSWPESCIGCLLSKLCPMTLPSNQYH